LLSPVPVSHSITVGANIQPFSLKTAKMRADFQPPQFWGG
jgi:hypothetical protein